MLNNSCPLPLPQALHVNKLTSSCANGSINNAQNPLDYCLTKVCCKRCRWWLTGVACFPLRPFPSCTLTAETVLQTQTLILKLFGSSQLMPIAAFVCTSYTCRTATRMPEYQTEQLEVSEDSVLVGFWFLPPAFCGQFIYTARLKPTCVTPSAVHLISKVARRYVQPSRQY